MYSLDQSKCVADQAPYGSPWCACRSLHPGMPSLNNTHRAGVQGHLASVDKGCPSRVFRAGRVNAT